MNGPKKKAAISRRGPSSEQPVGVVAGERELIVVARAERSLRVRAESVASSIGADVDSLAKVLAEEKVSLVPLFGPSEEHVLRAAARAPGAPVEEMARYYRIGAPDERLDELAARLAGQPEIEAAFVKPAAEPAIGLNDMAPSAVDAPPVTPDFTARQIYLNGAPAGIDARFAWTKPGGSGAGVRIIDIEGAWRFTHEDLAQNQGGLVGGTHSPEILWRNHGTAVIGEFSGDRNSIGVTGICPEANVRAVSIFGPGSSSAGAIRRAADLLDPGDIILIELHRAGPRFNFTGRSDQLGYIAIEWWPDDFAAIRYATSRGVIVVEAAGNGAENLDVAIYYVRPAGFPTT